MATPERIKNDPRKFERKVPKNAPNRFNDWVDEDHPQYFEIVDPDTGDIVDPTTGEPIKNHHEHERAKLKPEKNG